MGGGTDRCIGTVIYVYDPSTRQLHKRLIEAPQDGRDLSRATLQVDLITTGAWRSWCSGGALRR